MFKHKIKRNHFSGSVVYSYVLLRMVSVGQLVAAQHSLTCPLSTYIIKAAYENASIYGL